MTEPSLTIEQAGRIGAAIRALAEALPLYHGAVDALVADSIDAEIRPAKYAQSARIQRQARQKVTVCLATLILAWNPVQGAASGPQSDQEGGNRP